MQPQTIATYNQYMNTVDSAGDGGRHCSSTSLILLLKTGFILFREHQAQHKDVEELQRPADYSLVHFREEIETNLISLSMKILHCTLLPDLLYQESLKQYTSQFSPMNWWETVLCATHGIGVRWRCHPIAVHRSARGALYMSPKSIIASWNSTAGSITILECLYIGL